MKKPIEMIDDLQRQHSMGPYEFVSVEDCVKLMEKYAEAKAGQHETIVNCGCKYQKYLEAQDSDGTKAV